MLSEWPRGSRRSVLGPSFWAAALPGHPARDHLPVASGGRFSALLSPKTSPLQRSRGDHWPKLKQIRAKTELGNVSLAKVGLHWPWPCSKTMVSPARLAFECQYEISAIDPPTCHKNVIKNGVLFITVDSNWYYPWLHVIWIKRVFSAQYWILLENKGFESWIWKEEGF